MSDDDSASDEDLADHLLVFVYISAAHRFTFPLAYFYTTNASRQQLYEWLWDGVALLTTGMPVV